MADLDEFLWSSGNGSTVSSSDWKRILDHVFNKLSLFLGTPLIRITENVSDGFFVKFESVEENDPFKLRARGTIGIGPNQFPFLQGFVYLYHGEKRIIAMSGENHLYLRYQRTAAGEKDWDMSQFSGPSDWYSFGWSVDEYGEFEG